MLALSTGCSSFVGFSELCNAQSMYLGKTIFLFHQRIELYVSFYVYCTDFMRIFFTASAERWFKELIVYKQIFDVTIFHLRLPIILLFVDLIQCAVLYLVNSFYSWNFCAFFHTGGWGMRFGSWIVRQYRP